MTARDILDRLKHGLIVSCQAEGDSPFNSPTGVAMFAQAAQQGGAVGIRSEGIAKTRRIVETVSLPTIGLVKTAFADGSVCITGSLQAVEDLLATGCQMVAIDGTFRPRPAPHAHLDGPEFVRFVKDTYGCAVMADISTAAEGDACVAAGADCLSTTLSGYTPDTQNVSGDGPDVELLAHLAVKHTLPVIAEGRIHSPQWATIAIERGAWAVVVGTAITRPATITQWYAKAVRAAANA
jgi:N-acylglucosamine-6-phosphate 2-epimerase